MCYTVFVSKKNVTVTLEEEVARWARIRAAELDTSVSRLLGDLLLDMMLREKAYEAAMEQYLACEPLLISERGTAYPSRDSLHER